METILWYIAVPVTVFYLAQIVMTFMGMDGYDGVDADFDSDLELEDGESGTLQLFTVKNAVGFLMGLSWGAIIGLKDLSWGETSSFILGIFLGILIVLIQSSLFYFMSKLERKNVPSLQGAIGQTATVYLKIPEAIYGNGKVAVIINGSKKILDAFSTSGEIPTGGQCRVVAVVNDTLHVEPIK
jgi:hypothetical protein